MVLPPTTPAQASSTNVLMDEILVNLTEELVLVEDTDLADELDDSYEAIAGLVRKGRLQDDPTVYGIIILVHPANEDHNEILYDRHEHNGFRIPQPVEIGGTTPVYYWVKPIIIEFEMFFEQELEREVAQVKAQVVLSRARKAVHLLNNRFRDIPVDDFGEKPFALLPQSAYLREAGGPGTFIWRGEMVVWVLCSIDLDG